MIAVYRIAHCPNSTGSYGVENCGFGIVSVFEFQNLFGFFIILHHLVLLLLLCDGWRGGI